MTQEQLGNLLIKLKCCSATLTYNLSVDLSLGRCANYKKIFILQDYIEKLNSYELDGENCLTEEEFQNIVEQAKQLCSLCNCGDHPINE
jgi:hypothetical protein